MPARPTFKLVFGITDLQTKEVSTEDGEGVELVIDDSRFNASINPEWKTSVPPKSTFKMPKSWKARDTFVGDFNSYIINTTIDGKRGGDLLLWRGNVFGLSLDAIEFGHEIVNAFSILHPEYKGSGFKELPQTPLAEDNTLEAAALKRFLDHKKRRRKPGISFNTVKEFARDANYKKKQIKLGLNYTSFGLAIPNYMIGFKYVSRWAGFDIPWSDMRLIIYWEHLVGNHPKPDSCSLCGRKSLDK